MIIAAYNGQSEAVSLLRESESAITNAFGQTALMFAAAGGHLEIAKTLIYSINNTDIMGYSALDYARMSMNAGSIEVAEYLAKELERVKN